MNSRKKIIIRSIVLLLIPLVGITLTAYFKDAIKAFNNDVDGMIVEKNIVFVSKNLIEKNGVTYEIESLINDIIEDESLYINLSDSWENSYPSAFVFSDEYMYVNTHISFDEGSLNRVFQISLDTLDTQMVITSSDEIGERLSMASDRYHLLALNRTTHELHVSINRNIIYTYMTTIPALNDSYEMYVHDGVLYRYQEELTLSNIVDALVYMEGTFLEPQDINSSNLLSPLSFVHADKLYQMNHLTQTFAIDEDDETTHIYDAKDIMVMSEMGEDMYQSLKKTSLREDPNVSKVFLNTDNQYLMAFKFKANHSGFLFENQTKYIGFLFDYLNQVTYYGGTTTYEPLYMYVDEVSNND